MTRKDYVLISRTLYTAMPPVVEKDARRAWYGICKGMAHALAIDSPRFDSDRFLLACGVEA